MNLIFSLTPLGLACDVSMFFIGIYIGEWVKHRNEHKRD